MNGMYSRLNFRLIFLWLLYGFVLTGILLYVRFPAEELKRFSSEYVEALFPGTDCRIGSLSYSFPLTLKAREIRLSAAEKPDQVVFETSSLAIRPHLRFPLQEFVLSGELYGGSHRSILQLHEKGAFSLQGLEITNLQLQQLQYLQEQLGRSLAGKVTINGEYFGSFDRLTKGEARGRVELIEGSLELLQPILSLNSIDLQRSAFDFELKELELIIGKGMFDGNELKGGFAGSIGIEETFFGSEFDLDGDLEVRDTLLSGNTRVKSIVSSLQRRHKRTTLPFTLSGTVDKPLFRFGI